MDFGMMLKLGGMWAKFTKNHPKFPQFIAAIKSNGLKENMIIDIKLTYDDGKQYETNLKLTNDDLQMIEKKKKLQSKS